MIYSSQIYFVEAENKMVITAYSNENNANIYVWINNILSNVIKNGTTVMEAPNFILDVFISDNENDVPNFDLRFPVLSRVNLLILSKYTNNFSVNNETANSMYNKGFPIGPMTININSNNIIKTLNVELPECEEIDENDITCQRYVDYINKYCYLKFNNLHGAE